MIHILHIANSYGGTEVYRNLVQSIDREGVRQTIYVPLNPNNHDRIGRHLVDFEVVGSRVIYSTALKRYHKYLYRRKVKRCVDDLLSRVDIREISLIQASTLCVDGAVAYEIHKRYNIPFVVAVRNTDSAYYRSFPIYARYFDVVAKAASKLIFISPSYLRRYERFGDRDSVVVPNGVDNHFFGVDSGLRTLHSPVRLIFSSAFMVGKNLREVLLAIDILKKRGYDIHFKAYGRGLPFRKESPKYLREVEQLAQGKSNVELLDYISKDELKVEVRDSDIFVMPSKPETFGLVYIEALLQGLPIVYARGEGFDGYYPDGYVGYAAESFNVEDIADKIELTIKNYNQITANIAGEELSERFQWSAIAKQYLAIYEAIIKIGKR
ncbi:MAG: glycosyltransferase family 4 protein [Rikenellaceae bacterium]